MLSIKLIFLSSETTKSYLFFFKKRIKQMSNDNKNNEFMSNFLSFFSKRTKFHQLFKTRDQIETKN